MSDEPNEQDAVEKDILFQFPLPPPPFGPPPVGRVMYFHGDAEGEAAEGRTSEDLMLRSVPRETAMRFRAAAGGRSLTYAQYLAALVALHEAMRELAGDDERVRAELDRLGLQTVTV